MEDMDFIELDNSTPLKRSSWIGRQLVTVTSTVMNMIVLAGLVIYFAG
jgi:hypothetical protein